MEKKTIWHTPDTIPNDIWAYKKDVDATSKALDVARDMYESVAQDYIGNLCGPAPQYVSGHVAKMMSNYDKKISEIIGGK